jgi:hypothetical protein
MTVSEAAEIIGCAKHSVYRMVEKGLIQRRDLPVDRKYWAADVLRIAGFTVPTPSVSNQQV